MVDWNRDRLITQIVLRRLTPAETREQLSVLLGQEVAADFAAAVHRETEGNPFFVEEVLKALIEQGSFGANMDSGARRRSATCGFRRP